MANLPSPTVLLRRSRWLAVPVVAAVALVALALPSLADGPDTVPPTTPGVPVATFPASGTVTLTWTPSTDNVGVTQYRVVRWYTDFGQIFTTPTSSITFNDLRPSGTYRFTVSAVDAAGNVSGQSAITLTMPPGDSQPPTAPGTPIASNVTATEATLSWGPSTDNVIVEVYQILRIQPSGTTVFATTFSYPGPPTSIRLTGLTTGTTYRFAVRARDAVGNLSAPSGEVSVTPGGTTAGCSASYQIVSQWPGAFQGTVTVRNTGTSTITGWTVRWTFGNGQVISGLSGGEWTQVGAAVTVRNASWNGTLGPNATTGIWFQASWSATNSVPTVSCASP